MHWTLSTGELLVLLVGGQEFTEGLLFREMRGPIYSRSLFSGTGSAAGLLCSVSSRLIKFWCQLFLGWCWGDTACIFWHKGPLLLETAHLELTVLPHSEHCFTLSFGLLLILEGPLVPVLLLGDSSPSPVLCKTLTKVTASLAFWDNTSPPRVHCWEPTSDFRAPLPDFSCFSHWCFPSLYNSWMLFIS